MKDGNERNDRQKVSKYAEKMALSIEYPWLKKHFNLDYIDRVSIRPVTMELLTEDCGYQYAEDTEEHYEPARLKKTILLFAEDGQRLVQVGCRVDFIPAKTNREFLWFRLRDIEPHNETVLFQETIGQALVRVGEDRVHYVVTLMTDQEVCRLVFNAPKEGKTFLQTLEDEETMARESVRKALRVL